MRELWIDFNDLDRKGRTITLAQYAEPGVSLSIGLQLLVGDDEGNLCKATVTGLGKDGTVGLALDLGSFVGCDDRQEAWA